MACCVIGLLLVYQVVDGWRRVWGRVVSAQAGFQRLGRGLRARRRQAVMVGLLAFQLGLVLGAPEVPAGPVEPRGEVPAFSLQGLCRHLRAAGLPPGTP